MDFSIIKTGGKQYIAKKGDTLRIEKIAGDFKVGDTVNFDEVLMTSNSGKFTVGTPTVSGASVKATIKEVGHDDKVTVIKYMPKSRYYKKNGHKQPNFIVEIA